MSFDIFSTEGNYIGHSESDDALAAAVFFLNFRGGDMWAISLVDNDDGSITASFGDRTIQLRPKAQN